jgi:threonine/homoserine/homoserine lactone efflux protein
MLHHSRSNPPEKLGNAMPNGTHWGLFFAATIMLLITPGPSVMYVVGRAIDHGYRGAIFSSVGLAFGDLFQVLCTVVGLSALLASSSVLFTVVKYAGAAYLIILGLRRLLNKDVRGSGSSLTNENDAARASSGSLVIQGFFALNPKTALFFLALFPQFVAEDAGPAWLQILLLGCAFVALGFVTNSIFGCIGGKLRLVARRNHRFQVASRYFSGGTLVALGVAAALAQPPSGVFHR